ncbi:GDSL-type esterase/lipase family protein [Thiovibrio sp. JS02]
MPMRVLFLGDSLIEYYDWQDRFPDQAVRNAGQAGETVAGLLARLPGLLQRRPTPEMVILMIGTNNLLMEDYAFLPDYGRILATIAAQAPAAGIACTSLLPMPLSWLADTAVARINASLHRLVTGAGASYLDLYAAFTKGGEPAAAYFEGDGVHLSGPGYALWSREIAALLGNRA